MSNTGILFASLSIPAVAALATASAVSLPILIHLLFRQRFRVVEWAAMRFLNVARKKSSRRIDRWLLLALRIFCVLIPLLGMMAATPWAEPFWQSIRPGTPETLANAPRTHLIIVLDRSLSMTARADQRSRYELAMEQAISAIESRNPGDGFSLVALGSQTESVVPGPSNDTAKVLSELKELKPGHGLSNLGEGLAAVNDILARSPRSYLRRQILLLTDLQATTWTDLIPKPDQQPAETWLKLTSRGDLAVVDCARERFDNSTVASVKLSDPLPLVGDAPTITAVIQHFGQSPRQKVGVELLIGRPAESGKSSPLIALEQQTIDEILPNDSLTVRFTLPDSARFRSAGTHAVQVRLVEADDLPADDYRAMTFTVRDGLPCVLVNGKPSTVPLERATEMLADAIAPGGKPRPGHPGRPKVVSLEEFSDATLSDLSQVDCVFLCDVPMLTPSQIARLEAVLKRGGGVVFGLGARVEANREFYNRVLFDNGNGLFPGKIESVESISGPDDPGFRLVGDDASFQQPPLSAEFQDLNGRAGLSAVPFRKYLRLEIPNGRGRRILSFSPSVQNSPDNRPPDPAVVEWTRQRGRVIVYTSTFNRDWNDWPILPTYPVFVGELLRHAATNPERQSIHTGDVIEEYLPPYLVGLTAKLTDPTGADQSCVIATSEEGGVARFTNTRLSGMYTFQVEGQSPKQIAVTIPEAGSGRGSESDLRRVDTAKIQAIHPSIQVVLDPNQIAIQDNDGTTVTTTPKPHGPLLGRWLVSLGLLLLTFELVLAWRLGPARIAAGLRGEPAPSTLGATIFKIIACVFVLLATAVMFTIFHARTSGELLGFLPDSWRQSVEQLAGVPSAGPGEGTRWRLESSSAWGIPIPKEQLIQWGLFALACGVVIIFYRYERRATGGTRRVILPALLRLSAYALAIFVLMPQLKLSFDREGWPDIAVIIDNSGSMSTVDDPQDPALQEQLARIATIPGLEKPQRIQLARWLLTHPDQNWLERLVLERKLKVHVYALAQQPEMIGSIHEVQDIAGTIKAVDGVLPDGTVSRLGDGVQAVLKAFRGGSLAAIILMTDGITTDGTDLTRAGQIASRAQVPLHIVGLGDTQDVIDLSIGDLRSDDVVAKNDEIVYEGRLTATGPGIPSAITVTLSEKIGNRFEKRDEATIQPDRMGKPVPFRLKHIPSEAGERTYIIEVPTVTGEREIANNTIERQIVVTENRRLRVLYLEGYPRYEYRFIKVLLEREIEPGRTEKAVDLQTLLLDASVDHATTDRSALRGFPTRNELFEYDVVILGDVDPAQLDRPNQRLQDLADFVRVKGGGLISIAGEFANPHKLFDTPLADVLPVANHAEGLIRATSEDAPLVKSFQPKFTPAGATHPLFRLAASETDSATIWRRLKPIFWSASGYTRKQSAEVLAVHPERAAEDNPGEQHPLVLQQFFGQGRSLFLGFDETWRWRFRKDEEQFNRFWRQAITVLARNRIRRIELKTNKQTSYRQDEPIRITVLFPDDAPPPGESIRVGVERRPLRDRSGKVLAGDNESRTLTLTKIRGSRATYETTLPQTPVGEYEFHLSDPEPNGIKPRAEARVLPPPGEYDRLEMNRTELLRAATESRGKFYTIVDAEKLIDELPEVERLPLNQPCPPIPLWNHAVTFALLLFLLGWEWIVRKQERLA